MHPIADYRRAKGLTQTQLAKLVGVNINTVQGWERGVLPYPRYIPKLAEALGVDALELNRELRVWKLARIEAQRTV